jgi:hypothetical protein
MERAVIHWPRNVVCCPNKPMISEPRSQSRTWFLGKLSPCLRIAISSRSHAESQLMRRRWSVPSLGRGAYLE